MGYDLSLFFLGFTLHKLINFRNLACGNTWVQTSQTSLVGMHGYTLHFFLGFTLHELIKLSSLCLVNIGTYCLALIMGSCCAC